jgi:hypothetical protein
MRQVLHYYDDRMKLSWYGRRISGRGEIFVVGAKKIVLSRGEDYRSLY